jgi:hypothetical protein
MRNVNIARGFRHLLYQRNNREYESPYTIPVLSCVLLDKGNIKYLSKNKFIFIKGKEKYIEYTTSHCKRIR